MRVYRRSSAVVPVFVVASLSIDQSRLNFPLGNTTTTAIVAVVVVEAPRVGRLSLWNHKPDS